METVGHVSKIPSSPREISRNGSAADLQIQPKPRALLASWTRLNRAGVKLNVFVDRMYQLLFKQYPRVAFIFRNSMININW